MYVIKNSLNLYWAGSDYGCDIWKSRFTCACIYNSRSYAEKQIISYNLTDCEVVYMDYRE